MAWIDDVYRREAERLRSERERGQPPAPALPSGLESDRAHLFTPFAAAAVPAMQALITGLMYGLAAWVAAWLLERAEPWRYGLAAYAATQAVIWTINIVRWQRLTRPLDVLDFAERLLRMDIDGDGMIADEIPAPQITHIEITRPTESSRAIAYLSLPIDAERMRMLADGLAHGRPFSEAEWRGVLSRAEYRAVRQELLGRNLACWNSELDRRQGVRLTPDGLTMFQALAAGAAPPALSERNP